MKKVIFLLSLAVAWCSVFAQSTSYVDSLRAFRNDYVDNHEVVKKDDKQFMHFFAIDPAFRTLATFTPAKNPKWFAMKTSGSATQTYRKYGMLTFKIHDTTINLSVYQSQSLMTSKDYADYLFIPFTDNTSGRESYGGGRYLDYKLSDIQNNKLLLDFNKAYNPYCAYTSGYNCPVPPGENDLRIAITAGEKAYDKKH
jgi:uncharacterized protein